MKKLVLTTACSLAMVGATFAQGLLNWASAPSVNFIVQSNSAVYSPFFGGGSTGGGTNGNEGPNLGGGPGFYLDLLYSGQNTTGLAASQPGSLAALTSQWNTTGLYASNALAATANGRVGFITPNGSAPVPWGGNTDANGESNNIVMAGWSANLGSTWAVVSSNLLNWATVQGGIVGPAFFGLSGTGFLVGNDTPASGATLFGSTQTPNGLPLYQPAANPMFLDLIPLVPEPTTMTLAGLAGLSLLLFRRQRK